MNNKSIFKKYINLKLILSVIIMIPSLLHAKDYGNGHPISWKQQGHNIILDSVCYNYKKGDIVYRRCRSEAKIHFKKQCAIFTRKYKYTKEPYNQEYEKKMDMYCYAARTFRPVEG